EIHSTMLRRGIEAQRLLGVHKKALELIEEKDEPTNERGNLIKVGEELYAFMEEELKDFKISLTLKVVGS
ncbi:hypothetical protein O181_113182, partial [Austropuccinia psidii MF-1]|nr:hypothetical protein [Austropuccinia psidii MF-1]